MSQELPDKLLDISLDDARREARADEAAEDEVEYERFFFFEVAGHRLAIAVDAVRTVLDPPEAITPIPRTAPGVEGVTDIRGEVTAIVDPTILFTDDSAGRPDRPVLLLDRTAGGQPAAMRVDDVHGVDAVPRDQVHDSTTVEKTEFDGDSLDHPLVEAVIEREHEQRSVESPTESDTAGSGSETGAEGPVVHRTVVVEGTPLLDVDRLLTAIGHTEPAVEAGS